MKTNTMLFLTLLFMGVMSDIRASRLPGFFEPSSRRFAKLNKPTAKLVLNEEQQKAYDEFAKIGEEQKTVESSLDSSSSLATSVANSWIMVQELIRNGGTDLQEVINDVEEFLNNSSEIQSQENPTDKK